MSRRFSPLRFLRSRRLAVGLIVGLAVYVAAATAVPVDRPITGILGRLGFGEPFSHPFFLAALAVLAASTAVCSWERTRFALRVTRERGKLSSAAISRLESRPGLPVSSATALEHAEERLRGIGLRTRRGPRMLEASAGLWGVWGSPLFHWALTALFIVLAFGRLTRADGQMGVPVGGERLHEIESYGTFDAGAWYRPSSAVSFRVSDLDPDHVDERGIKVGPAPLVQVLRGGNVVAEQRVYPNRPLRSGSLLIHATDGFGLAAWVSVETTSGQLLGATQTISDFDTGSKTGTTPGVLGLGSGDQEVRIDVSPVAQATTKNGARYLLKQVPEDQRAQVRVERPGREQVSEEVRAGGTVDLGDGYRLRLERLTLYARIAVADDWSVPWIYALFAIAAIGLTVAVFVPHRWVRVLLAKDGATLHAEWRHARRDLLFEQRVRETLQVVTEVSTNTTPDDADETREARA